MGYKTRAETAQDTRALGDRLLLWKVMWVFTESRFSHPFLPDPQVCVAYSCLVTWQMLSVSSWAERLLQHGFRPTVAHIYLPLHMWNQPPCSSFPIQCVSTTRLDSWPYIPCEVTGSKDDQLQEGKHNIHPTHPPWKFQATAEAASTTATSKLVSWDGRSLKGKQPVGGRTKAAILGRAALPDSPATSGNGGTSESLP